MFLGLLFCGGAGVWRVDSFAKAKGTSAGIFQLRLLIMYCWSFSSAADWGSGIESAIGFLSFFPRGLWVIVTACTVMVLLWLLVFG